MLNWLNGLNGLSRLSGLFGVKSLKPAMDADLADLANVALDDVTLADAPKTPWFSGMWAKVMGGSLGGSLGGSFAGAFDATLATDGSKMKPSLHAPVLPEGVVPAVPASIEEKLAMDYAGNFTQQYAGALSFSQGFIGYPALAELAQLSEYRAVAETTSAEMIREWIDLRSIGDNGYSDTTERIQAIKQELERHHVRQVLRDAVLCDHFFGRAQIFIDIKGQGLGQGAGLQDARANPLLLTSATLQKGALRGFKNIEPMWTSPVAYNSTDPSARDFFKPRAWYVLGQEIHASRLMTIIMRPVPDVLKPAYNFGGVSMTQLMQPYVDRWLKTVDSVSEMVSRFSVSGIETNLSNVTTAHGYNDMLERAKKFNDLRDNLGVMLLDKNQETFFQFNTPLSGLDALLAQTQEHMAAPSHTPLVKLTGITPTGLNANSEGEIAVYYDHIAALQEAALREPLQTIIKLIQLDVFGDIDDNITFDFKPLQQLDGAELTAARKSDADRDVAYLQAGVLNVAEVRSRLSSDAESGFSNLGREV